MNSDPPTSPLTWLQRLEDASLGERGSAFGRKRVGLWRGFAFTLDTLNLVVPFADGLAVARCRDVQPLPLCHEWVAGAVAIRGEVYTVVDFARFIGVRPAASQADADLPSSPSASLLILPGDHLNSALLLDSRISVRTYQHDLPGAQASRFPAEITPFLRTRVLDGNQPWGVLDIEALTHSEKFISIGR